MKLIIDYPGIGNATISNQIICEMLNNNSEIIEAISNKRIFGDMLLRNKDKINLILSIPALLNELIANENATLLVSYCGWLIDEPDKLSNNLKKQSLIDLLNNTNLFIPFISTYKDQHNLINLIINHPETAMIIIPSKSLIKLLTETNPQLVIDLLNNKQLLSNFINDPFCIFSN